MVGRREARALCQSVGVVSWSRSFACGHGTSSVFTTKEGRMSTQYVIHKKSRSPLKVSYDGPTWDCAGIRHRRRDTYDDLVYAQATARILSEFNPVGFDVSPTSERTS